MQTKKKSLARNASREHANSISSRHQKKGSSASERKVTDMITSSTKKTKNGRSRDTKSSAIDLRSEHSSTYDEAMDTHLSNKNFFHHKVSDNETTLCVLETIFSPAFHLPKDGSGGISVKVDFADYFSSTGKTVNLDEAVENTNAIVFNAHANVEKENIHENRTSDISSCACDNSQNIIGRPSDSSNMSDVYTYMPHIAEAGNRNSPYDEEFKGLGNLSPEVSAIYLAMQHSKLECVDVGQESMSTDSCLESEDDEDFDNFDPYLFIKNLPDLSAVVPTFRPMLLPRQTRSCPSTTLVLDLDETLVHSTLEPCEGADFTFPVNFNLREHTVYVRCRPHLKDFMERVASLFEIIIFTASQSIYAEQLLNVLDPKKKLFRHRVYRESCVFVEGNYLKDLSVLGRDLSRVIIIDNSPQAFGFQIDNGIPIESWFDDRSDQELLLLLPFLESLVDVEDVRPFIGKKFNLREKVAAATCLTVDYS